MDLPSRRVRIAALGSLLTVGSTALLAGSAGAAPAPQPDKSHGHVHVDKKAPKTAVKGAKRVDLTRQCSAYIRPHKYDEGANPTITVAALGKKPTATKSFIDLDNESSATSAVRTGLDGFVVNFGNVVNLDGVKPHGHIHYNKDGSIKKNDLHWHIKVLVTDDLADKTWKKDIKVYNCDPFTPTAIDEDECPTNLFGSPSIGLKNGKINAGEAFSVKYNGVPVDPEEDADDETDIPDDVVDAGFEMTIDGAPVDLIADPTSPGTFWYASSFSMLNGKHDAVLTSTDVEGTCSQAFSFVVSNGKSGTT